MPKRLIHKRAIRYVSISDKSQGIKEVQLCHAMIPYHTNNPLLSDSWANVTCKYCDKAKFNGVPEGIGKRELTLLQGGVE